MKYSDPQNQAHSLLCRMQEFVVQNDVTITALCLHSTGQRRLASRLARGEGCNSASIDTVDAFMAGFRAARGINRDKAECPWSHPADQHMRAGWAAGWEYADELQARREESETTAAA